MRASKVRVRWLNPRSIIWMETHNKNLWYACKRVRFTRSIKGRNHPWINGRGSKLSSNLEEPVYGDQIHR